MSVPRGLRLVTLSATMQRNKIVCIIYCDYSGHRAHRDGCHYTARYELEITPEELFKLLEPHFTVGSGNQPDLAKCSACGDEVWGDELEIDWDSEGCKGYCQRCWGGIPR